MLNISSQNLKHYIIAEKIYNDTYQYNSNDIKSIDDNMLASIILNKNKDLFNAVIKEKKLNSKQVYDLLNMISIEGDEYIYFFDILYNAEIESDLILNITKNAIKSNSIKILKKLNLKNIENKVINDNFKFNPTEEILNFIIQQKEIYLIENEDILSFMIENDYLSLFIIYLQYNIHLNKSLLLDKAIKQNAYDIIDYLLNEIKEYDVHKNISIYDEYFDYLSTLNFDKIDLFLSKIKDIKIFGVENLEKLLLGISNNENIEKLLFNYNLLEIKVNNKDLELKIGKIKLNHKLKKQLEIKNNKIKKEKI